MSNPYASPQAAVSDYDNNETYDPKIFSTSGRIGRVRYLVYGFVISFLVALVAAFAVGLLAGLSGSQNPMAGNTSLIVIAAIYIPVFIAYLVVIKRRLNDLNQTGWLGLLILIPFVNFLFGIYLTFWPGNKSGNKFGPAPKPNSTLLVVFGLVVPIAFVGILAAIAIPAYQDYVKRAQAAQSQQVLPQETWQQSQ